MKKKKILIYIHQGVLKGGVEKVFYNLLNNLPLENYDITVLSVMGYLKDDFDGHLYPSAVKRYCLYWDEFSKSNPLRRLTQKIHNRIFPTWMKMKLKFQRFDVAIAAQEGSYARYVIDNVQANKKLLWIHNDIEQCHWTLNFFGTNEAERRCYNSFDKVVCVSESVTECMRRVFGSMSNLVVCYNPIDTTEIDAKLQERLPERPSEHTWFICAGRLCHQKAYDRLINVCHRLNQEGYKYDVSVLGDGEDRKKLERMLSERNIDNIHLIGNVSNPFVYMKQADWLLLPSRHEGFGMVLHEATYCKTPIITTDVSGARELLGDSEYGIVMENSENDIYHTLKFVLDNPAVHQKYAQAITRRAEFVNLQERINKIRDIIDN